MDAKRFDAVARALTDGVSRRAAFGFPLAGIFAVTALNGIEAKRKKKKKGKKKGCKSGARKCGGRCIAADGCCADAECAGGAACQESRCVCPSECCVDTDCPAVDGSVCRAEACRCPIGQGFSGGVCGTPPDPGSCFEAPSICESNEQCCNDNCVLGQGGVKRCTPSQVGEPCLAASYCQEGLVCRGFVCDPPSQPGGPCTTAGDCAGLGALCVDRRCV